MSKAVLQARGLTKTFSTAAGQGITVLKDVSLELGEGEMVAVVGPSGAGKSTLLHILGGLDSPDAGDVFLRDSSNSMQNLAKLSDEKLAAARNRHIGYIFQFHHLLPEFSAIENVMMPALISGMSRREAQAGALALLDEVGLADRKDQRPVLLSGGEQQRVSVARALINKPSVVFADEPTGNLDAANSRRLIELLQRVRRDHRQAFLVATHDQELAQQADRVLRLSKGAATIEIPGNGN